MFNNKYTVTILNTLWVPIKSNIKLKVIPRREEMIFIKEFDKYFEVINVVHTIDKTQNTFIIVSPVENQKKI